MPKLSALLSLHGGNLTLTNLSITKEMRALTQYVKEKLKTSQEDITKRTVAIV